MSSILSFVEVQKQIDILLYGKNKVVLFKKCHLNLISFEKYLIRSG